MGVHVTAPGWATFTVKPKIGELQHASITVPSLRGYINVTATPTAVEVGVPCNTQATLCLPRSAHVDKAQFTVASTALLLDGLEVEAKMQGEHLRTVQPTGCGVNGAQRKLSARTR